MSTGSVHFEMTMDNDQFMRKIRESRQAILDSGKNAEIQASKIEGMHKRMAQGLGAIGGSLAGGAFVKDLIRITGQFQVFEAVLTNTLQSPEKAKSSMKMLSEFAATTPFQVDELTGSFVKLANQGFTPTYEEMTKLGDLASSTGKGFGQLAEAILDAQVGEFERLKEFGIRASKEGENVTFTFKDVATQVDFTASSIREYILSLGALEGVMGSNAKISATLTGQMSNLQDGITNMMNEIGQSSEGALSGALSGASYLVEHYEEVGRVLAVLIAAYGTYKASIMAIVAVEKVQKAGGMAGFYLKITSAIKGSTLAQQGFNKAAKAHPYILLASALIAVGGLVWAFSKNTENAARSQDKFNDSTKEAIASVDKEKVEIDMLFDRLKKAKKGTEEYTSAKMAIQDKYGKYLKNMSEEIRSLNDIAGAYALISEKAIQAARDKAISDLTSKNAADYAQTEVDAIGKMMGYFKRGGLNDNQATNAVTRIIGAFRQGSEISVEQKKQAEIYLREAFKDHLSYGAGSATVDGTEVYDFWIGGMLESLTNGKKSLSTEIETINKIMSAGLNFGAKIESPNYSYAYKSAEQEWKDAKIVYDKIITDKTATVEAYNAAKLKLENTEKAFQGLGGKTNTTLQDTDTDADEAYTKAHLSRIAKKQKEQTKLERAGIADRYKLLDFDHNLRLELLAKERAEAEKAAKDSGQKFDSKPYDDAVFNETLAYYSELGDLGMEDIATQIEASAKEKTDLDTLLEKYKSYEKQRTDIHDKYKAERDELKAGRTDDNTDKVDTAINNTHKAEKRETSSVNDAEYQDAQKDAPVIAQIFENTSRKSIAEINTIREKAQELLSYLASTESESITAGFSMTAEQLRTLQSSTEEMDKLHQGVEQLHSDGVKKNPFGQMAKDLKDLFNSDDKSDDLAGKLEKLGASAASSANMIGGLAGGLSDMFAAAGNEEMAGIADGVEMAMTSVSNVASGFANGGIVGGIAAAAGEALKFATMAFQAEAMHQAALEKITETKIAQEREHNMLLMEKNLLYEQGNTIFGSDGYGKANNALKVSKEAFAQMRADIEGVKGAQVVTGHKKTGLFGWGKGKDTYSNILSVYNDLIDSEGKLNVERANSILATENLSDEHKQVIEQAIASTELYESAMEETKSYLTDIFGDLGGSMMDALTDAFASGTDAGEAFGESMSDMLEQLAKDMIYSVTLAPMIEQAQAQMQKIMNNSGLSDEEKFNKFTGVLDGMMDSAIGEQGMANDLFEKFQQMAADKGFEIFDDESEREGSSKGGIATASQESVDENNGRLTSIHGIIFDMSDSQKQQLELNIANLPKLQHLGTMNSHLATISENTAYCRHLEAMGENMGQLQSDMSAVKLTMTDIQMNGLRMKR